MPNLLIKPDFVVYRFVQLSGSDDYLVGGPVSS